MHLVLRASSAQGAKSFLRARFNVRIRAILRKQAQINGVKLYGVANRGNHFHLLVLPRSRQAYLKFVRAISGLIARLVLEKERGEAKLESSSKSRQQKFSKAADQQGHRTAASKKTFWDQRPFSRIIEWGKNFRLAKDFLRRQTLPSIGFGDLVPIIAKNTS